MILLYIPPSCSASFANLIWNPAILRIKRWWDLSTRTLFYGARAITTIPNCTSASKNLYLGKSIPSHISTFVNVEIRLISTFGQNHRYTSVNHRYTSVNHIYTFMWTRNVILILALFATQSHSQPTPQLTPSSSVLAPQIGPATKPAFINLIPRLPLIKRAKRGSR